MRYTPYTPPVCMCGVGVYVGEWVWVGVRGCVGGCARVCGWVGVYGCGCVCVWVTGEVGWGRGGGYVFCGDNLYYGFSFLIFQNPVCLYYYQFNCS